VSRTSNVVTIGVALAALGGAVAYALMSGGKPHVEGSSQDKAIPAVGGVHRLSNELFAKSHTGDWHAYRTVGMGTLGKLRSVTVVAITAETTDAVTRTVKTKLDLGDDPKPRDELQQRVGLTLEKLTNTDSGGWALFDVTAHDEVHTANGRTFACTRIAYSSTDPMFARKKIRTELWISKEVPAGGMVASHETTQLDSVTTDITTELIGYGNGTTPTWGSRPLGI
jgi:hypothetical protein